MALKMIIHAFRMIFSNLGQALRVSVGPSLILWIGNLALSTVFDPIIGNTGGLNLVASIYLFLALALSFFVSAWIAVSWHRFILLEEYADVLPPIKDRPIWPYVVKVLLMTLILGLMAGLMYLCYSMLTLFPLAAGGQSTGPFIDLLTLAVIFAGLLVLVVARFRMGVALVATALGNTMTFRDAVGATRQVSRVVWGVTILLIIFGGLLSFVVGLVANTEPLTNMVLETIVSWLLSMFGISILTTIYGHVIENRPLIS